MPWWGWLSIGIFLMGAEILGVDAAFYLFFVGIAAIIVGLIGLAGVTLPEWGQWLLFSALALASMVFFREKVYKRIRGNAPGYGNTLVGEIVEVDESTTPGSETRVSLRGSVWTAINAGEDAIPPGTKARVIDSEGMTLKIRAAKNPSAKR